MICLDTLPPLDASCDFFENFLSTNIALYQLAFPTSLDFDVPKKQLETIQIE